MQRSLIGTMLERRRYRFAAARFPRLADFVVGRFAGAAWEDLAVTAHRT